MTRRIESIDDYYVTLRKIASTSKSNIWLVKDSNGQFACLKELFIRVISKSQQQVDHVWNEKKILERLTEDNSEISPQLIATSKSPSSLFFIMELIVGAPLCKHLPRRGFPLSTVREYFMQLVSIIEYLHTLHIVYRDLKLSNVILNSLTGKLILCDYGHAKFLNRGRTNSVCGTPHIMAPEVTRGEDYSFECDFWSLGICLYEMIEGRPPFGYEEKWTNRPQSMDFSSKHCSDSINLISSLLQWDSTKRLCSFQEIRDHGFLFDFEAKNADFDPSIAQTYIFGDEDDFY
jgi:serine/threonine protein kinase